MPGWTPTRGWMVFGDRHTVLGYSNLACVTSDNGPAINELIANLAELAEL